MMKLTTIITLLIVTQALGKGFAQSINLHASDITLVEAMRRIQQQSGYAFFLTGEDIGEMKVNTRIRDASLKQALSDLLIPLSLEWSLRGDIIIIKPSKTASGEARQRTPPEKPRQQRQISGRVVDESGAAVEGVTVAVKGSSLATSTDEDGRYQLAVPANEQALLVFSRLGYQQQEQSLDGRSVVDITLQASMSDLDEVVVVGYGTMKKGDLTGAISSVNMDGLKDQPSVSVAQSLQGSVAGLNIGQVNQAGEEPNVSIRGRTSLSGTQNPLIVLDGVIFRGSLIDINPNDIKTIDVLKDNSAAAVYGSQAANGVIIVTTARTSERKDGKPAISYSGQYAFQRPVKELRPGDAAYFVKTISDNEWRESRREESGYLEADPSWDVTSLFKTDEQTQNYLNGMDTDWYGLVTNDRMYTHNQNVNIANQGSFGNYFLSLGYTDQVGHMVNEDYERFNARINVDSKITDWLTIGLQAFTSTSDYSGQSPEPWARFIMPFEAAYYDGELNPLLENAFVNPLVAADADHLDKRQNLFGNAFAEIKLPFIEGLTYRLNWSENQISNREYLFEPFALNYQGQGSKHHGITSNSSVDNRVAYNRSFSDKHRVEATFVYGFEKRKNDFTQAGASNFINKNLGYNRLDFGSSELQTAQSGAWQETSVYTMARAFYSFMNRYQLTGTFRRDGFSGFSKNRKFGTFPSVAFGWVVSEEPFFQGVPDAINHLKFRFSYGASGNRTVGRYQTLAQVQGGYNYVDESGNSVYTQYINSLASPSLRWETTTGINAGLDFGLLNSRISGSVEYYNNKTTNLLYIVDVPSIGRFNKFPDNLGELHNHGLEININSTNITNNEFQWTSHFVFSRNRNELRSLLGGDSDGDGIEDDLISEGLFIGRPLNTIYDYQITGAKYQLGDELPSGTDFGTNIIVDQNNDGKIDAANDRIILGYNDPSYRFGLNNQLRYRNWSVTAFINAVQGGSKYYFQENDVHAVQYGDQYNRSIPYGFDTYWMPETPDAKYQKKSDRQPGDLRGKQFAQRNFVRLQDVSLSYTFNNTILKRLHMNNMRVYVSGRNLFTWTKWEGWDPETGQGISRDGLPVLKSYTIGLNVEL